MSLSDPFPSAIARFEQSLSAAVARFAAGLREAEDQRAFGSAERRLVAFLAIEGLTDEACRDPAAVPAKVRARILDRLAVEERRMTRLARGARPGYDLNRHIALRRLISLLGLRTLDETSRRCSGRELNSRFRRRKRPGRSLPGAGPASAGNRHRRSC